MRASLQHEAHRISNKLITICSASGARWLTPPGYRRYAPGGIDQQRQQDSRLLAASFNKLLTLFTSFVAGMFMLSMAACIRDFQRRL